jgi:hypothetical protein
MKKIELDFTGMYHKVKLCNKFYLEGICELDMEDRYLYCPHCESPKVCGSLCVCFDTEEKWRAVDSEGELFDLETYVVVTCKGIPVGEVVEEDEEETPK